MNPESVFTAGVSGMGPALSPRGEQIVSARIQARDQVLDALEKRGLNADALAHRRCRGSSECKEGSGCACDQLDHLLQKEALLSCEGGTDIEEANELLHECQSALSEAMLLIRRQRGNIAHLEHRLAVQENMTILLREALAKQREMRREPTA